MKCLKCQIELSIPPPRWAATLLCRSPAVSPVTWDHHDAAVCSCGLQDRRSAFVHRDLWAE